MPLVAARGATAYDPVPREPESDFRAEAEAMTSGLHLRAVAVLIANFSAIPASAALTAEQSASVGVNPPPSATLPLDAPLKDLDGRPTTRSCAE